MLPVFLPKEGAHFPDPDQANPEGLVAIGGSLSHERLLRAYSMGIFPWYGADTPILWWSPDPRCVLLPQDLHISRSLRRTLKTARFTITLNQAFAEVIRRCAESSRPGQSGTWLVPEMIAAYIGLHQRGFALSAETWLNGELVGGLYGVHLGGVFYGESMFHSEPNASKAAFVHICHWLAQNGCTLIDCQQASRYMLHFGARNMPRHEFLRRLSNAILDTPIPAQTSGIVLSRTEDTHVMP